MRESIHIDLDLNIAITALGTKVPKVIRENGGLNLRSLTISDVQLLEILRKQNLTDREFSELFIFNQIKSPKINLEDIRSWDDKILLLIADIWAKGKNNISPSVYKKVTSFADFRTLLFEQQKYWFSEISVALNPLKQSLTNFSIQLGALHLRKFSSYIADQFSQILAPIIESNRIITEGMLQNQIKSLNAITRGFSEQINIIRGFSQFTNDFSENLLKSIAEPLKVKIKLFDNLPNYQIWIETVERQTQARDNFKESWFRIFCPFI